MEAKGTREAEHIYESFAYNRNEEIPELTTKAFDEHFVSNIIIHDHNPWSCIFHRQVQKPGETVEAFLQSLCQLVQHCKIGMTKDEQIRNWIIIGINNIEVSQKLQLESEHMLEKTIKLACQMNWLKSRMLCDISCCNRQTRHGGFKQIC